LPAVSLAFVEPRLPRMQEHPCAARRRSRQGR
jgi:hypothetical protein